MKFNRNSGGSLRRVGVCAFALGGVALFVNPNPASATPISGVSTLQDLINLGRTGVTIGDKQFYNFSYLGSPNSGPNPAPTANQIAVGQATGPNIGLTFSFGWLSAEGFNQDSAITYYVHTVDAAQQNFIDGVGLTFNGDAPLPGVLTNATVTEKVYDINGNQIGSLNTFDDGAGGNPDHDQSNFTLAPALRDIKVTKDIQVHSAAAQFNGGVSTISLVDNTFHQTTVPEPAALGLFTAAGLPLLARRRRQI